MTIFLNRYLIAALCVVSMTLAGCGGGGGSHDSDDSAPPPMQTPPPVEQDGISFNDTVRVMATSPTITDEDTDAQPKDINAPKWIFDDSEDAFIDAFL